MFWPWSKMNQTVKKLRKDQGFTAKELAEMAKIDTSKILKIEELKLKDVPEPLRTKIKPYVTGEYTDKIPWI
ncbi:MAG: transcriptional regulator [Peptococcia bacterium]